MSTSIAIGNIEIHQDKNGRYSLNDLYRASGGNPNHRPSKWLRTIQTQELISALKFERRNISATLNSEPKYGLRNIEPLSVTSTGNPETFVVKELVYAYAMWISPAFHLKVIRAYDAMVRGELSETKSKLWKLEKAYFAKYPRDKDILFGILACEPYWLIAKRVKCHVSTVGKAVKRMLEWGCWRLAGLKIQGLAWLKLIKI